METAGSRALQKQVSRFVSSEGMDKTLSDGDFDCSVEFLQKMGKLRRELLQKLTETFGDLNFKLKFTVLPGEEIQCRIFLKTDVRQEPGVGDFLSDFLKENGITSG